MQTKNPIPPAHGYLRMANSMLALSVAVSVIAFLIAYPYAAHFSLAIQIAAHLAIPICAGFLKLGYVIRLAAQEAIQRKSQPALFVPSVAHP